MKYKIVIYGIGEQYNKNFNTIKYFELLEQFSVVGVTAKWTPDSTSLDGYNIIKLTELHTVQYDFIIVMSDIYFDEIVRELTDRGIERSKIISYRVLQIPNLDFNAYIDFKNSKVSIISNNCWGGVICRTLGIECLSPFKNLSLEDNDYIKLLNNFMHYMECEMKFLEYAYNRNSQKNYPVMLLDDVKVHCNHDTNPEDAVEKWNRRRNKINYSNLFIEMYTESKLVMEQFLRIDGYKNKLCFVPFETDAKNVYQLSLYPGQSKFWETVNSNAGNGANSIAYNYLNLMLGMKAERQS